MSRTLLTRSVSDLTTRPEVVVGGTRNLNSSEFTEILCSCEE